MTFKQWLFSQLPNPKVSPYNWMLVVALVFIVGFVVVSTLLLKNKSQKQKRNVMLVVASVILFF
jgi:phosphoglycerol transferase MdoB-like AlkP superfamily enzyme